MGQASEKVKDGKLLRVSVDFDASILRVIITGDFFLHPEDKLELIEQAMTGLPSDVPADDLRRRIELVVAVNGITMVGITPEAIAGLVRRVIDDG